MDELPATAAASPTTGNAPLSVSFTGSASGGTAPYSYSWNFGDGSVASTAQNPSHTYNAAGTYTATLTVTDSASGTATANATITASPIAGTTPGETLLTSTGVIANNSSEPPHSGSWDAWLDGYGTTHTDTLSQSVTLPTGCANYNFNFWLHIDTAETSTTTAYDTLKVQVLNSSGTVLSTLATYSNLNHNTGYAQVHRR